MTFQRESKDSEVEIMLEGSRAATSGVGSCQVALEWLRSSASELEAELPRVESGQVK